MSLSLRNPWLTRFRPRPAATRRIVCFGPAGGGPSFYRKWPEFLPADTELIAINLPGREARLAEPPAHSIEGSAAMVARALADEPWRPTILFGHSMGALIAYETAHVLRARDASQQLALVVSGREAPDRVMGDRAFLRLPDAAFLEYVANRYGGIPIEVMQEPELRELVVPPLRADFAAVAAYREPSRPALDLPLVILSGVDDHQTSPDQVEGWRSRSSRPVRESSFPGGHFYLVQQVKQVVAEALAALEPQ
jgi:pyochelin biosynthetic protein PchC